MLAFLYQEKPVTIEDCIGRTMVDRSLMPLGFCLLWFREEGTVTIHAHFGKWLRVFPKDIIRGMKETADEARELGVRDTYMIADENVPDSDKLCAWVGGTKTDQYIPGHGFYWKLDLVNDSKI